MKQVQKTQAFLIFACRVGLPLINASPEVLQRDFTNQQVTSQ